MKRHHFTLTCLLLASASVHARHHHTNIDIAISMAPPPLPAQVIIEPPRGYSHCYVTQPKWINGVWIPAHQECIYPANTRSGVWVSGYWGCVTPSHHGRCGRWKWHANRWVRNGTHQDVHVHEQPYQQHTEHYHRPENTRVDIHEHEHEHGHEHQNQQHPMHARPIHGR